MALEQQPKASSSKATKSTSKQTKAKKEPAPKKEKGGFHRSFCLLLCCTLYSTRAPNAFHPTRGSALACRDVGCSSTGSEGVRELTPTL